MNTLTIPSKYLGQGLHVYCQKCMRPITKKPCAHVSAHRYQSRIWNPITKMQDKFKTHDTLDIEEAVDMHRAYKKHLVENNFEIVEVTEEIIDFSKISIKDAAKRYLDTIADADAFEFEKRELTGQHITDMTRYVERFLQAIKGFRGCNLSGVRAATVGRRDVDAFYKYVNVLDLSDRSYNAHMVAGQQFIKYLTDALKIEMANPFERVQLVSLNYNPEAISIAEFEQFLQAITAENGIGIKSQNTGERINFYRPWLRKVYMLAVLIGERGDGLVLLTWQDRKENMLRIPNWKVNRIKKSTGRKHVDTPITADLAEILDLFERGAPGDYVVEPEIENRETLKEFISKAFTHFWGKAGLKRKATFKSLRKTYVTQLTKNIGEKALFVKHGSIMTAVKHYLAQDALTEATKDVRLLNNLQM